MHHAWRDIDALRAIAPHAYEYHSYVMTDSGALSVGPLSSLPGRSTAVLHRAPTILDPWPRARMLVFVIVIIITVAVLTCWRRSHVDCSNEVKDFVDEYPLRAPQAVQSAIANIVKGHVLLEIGTRSGDGFACFARHTRSAIAVEFDHSYCRHLERRFHLHPSNGSAPPQQNRVLCESYDARHTDADYYTWWHDVPLYDLPVLLHLRRGQMAGRVRANATAVIAFNAQKESYRQLLPLASWTRPVPFDEREPRCTVAKRPPTMRQRNMTQGGQSRLAHDKCHYIWGYHLGKKGKWPATGKWHLLFVPVKNVDLNEASRWPVPMDPNTM